MRQGFEFKILVNTRKGGIFVKKMPLVTKREKKGREFVAMLPSFSLFIGHYFFLSRFTEENARKRPPRGVVTTSVKNRVERKTTVCS